MHLLSPNQVSAHHASPVLTSASLTTGSLVTWLHTCAAISPMQSLISYIMPPNDESSLLNPGHAEET